jgi:hypothetical protein
MGVLSAGTDGTAELADMGLTAIEDAVSAAAEDGANSVSLFKAPARGLGESQYAEGYKAADFPGHGAYFGLGSQGGRAIAESYAVHYGEGIIETRVPTDVYAENFAKFEMKYLGSPPGTELAIPGESLDLLSQFPRIWHGAS